MYYILPRNRMLQVIRMDEPEDEKKEDSLNQEVLFKIPEKERVKEPDQHGEYLVVAAAPDCEGEYETERVDKNGDPLPLLIVCPNNVVEEVTYGPSNNRETVFFVHEKYALCAFIEDFSEDEEVEEDDDCGDCTICQGCGCIEDDEQDDDVEEYITERFHSANKRN